MLVERPYARQQNRSRETGRERDSTGSKASTQGADAKNSLSRVAGKRDDSKSSGQVSSSLSHTQVRARDSASPFTPTMRYLLLKRYRRSALTASKRQRNSSDATLISSSRRASSSLGEGPSRTVDSGPPSHVESTSPMDLNLSTLNPHAIPFNPPRRRHLSKQISFIV